MDIQSFLKNAKKMQEEMQKVQKELEGEVVEATAGGGMVTARANGKQEIVSLRIEKEILTSGDQAMIQDLVLAAVNEALRKSQNLMQEKLGAIAGGLKLPGLF